MSLDVNLKESISWKHPRIGPLSNKEFLDVAKRFVGNLERVRWSGILLPWMIGKSLAYQDAIHKAESEASQVELKHSDFPKNLQTRMHGIVDAIEAECDTDVSKGFAMDDKAFHTIQFLIGWYGQPKPNGGSNDLLVGFDALFQSMIISAWTAVEIALEDLCDESKSILNGKHFEIRSSARRIPDLIQSKRGEVLISKENIDRRSGATKNFRSILATRVAYSCWFHNDPEDIDQALCSLEIDALALLRNVIVHSASKPDEHFRTQAKGIPSLQQWTDPNLTKIVLNGEDVRKIIESALKPIASLILAVDVWTTLKSGM